MVEKKYNLPSLNDVLLKNVIFSMENQNSKGYLDLETGEIVELTKEDEIVIVRENKNSEHNIALRISENEERFLAVPDWGPLDGFRIREQFVLFLKNPVYKEKLNKTLHTGRGVFRKFKDVLHTNPIILRQWYIYKADYMKAIVIKWYEYNKGNIELERLPLEEEELPNDLLLEEFEIEYTKDKQKIDQSLIIKKYIENKLLKFEKILLERRNKITVNPEYFVITSSNNKVVGYIEYEKMSDDIVEIVSYGIMEEYRGIGLFSLLIDRFIRQQKRNNFSEVLLPFISNDENLVNILKNMKFSCNLGYYLIDINVWIETVPTSEMMEV